MAKRFLDVAVVSVLLVLLAPLFVTVWVGVVVTMARPVLFRQRRPGLKGRPFTLYKFRTMSMPTEGAAEVASDDDRLTPTGRLLRSISLDELPQLYNVFRGDMSLVGPRPLLMRYLPRYTREQMRRHDVRPGLTGWAQVNGRNATSWEQRFALDVWYVDHLSLWLDVKILAMTVWKVVTREGISQAGRATMDEYRGGQN